MPRLVNEKKGLLALVLFSLGIFIFYRTELFAAPVRISEKGLGGIILSILLLVTGILVITRAIRKVEP